MKFLFVLLVATLVCPNQGLLLEENNEDLIFRQNKEDNKESSGGNTRKLVEKLVDDMTNAAKNATNSLREFSTGLQKEVQNFRYGVESFLSKERSKITNAVEGVYNTANNITSAVKKCIDTNLKKSSLLFSNILTKTLECADNHVKEFGVLIEKQNQLANEAIEYAMTAQEELKKCTEQHHGSFFGTNACLATVAIKTEIRGAGYIARSALGLAHLNLALGSMPVVLEACGAARFFEASVATGGYVVEIGKCSIASIFANVFGSSTSNNNLEPANVDLPQSTGDNLTENTLSTEPATHESRKLLKPLYSTLFSN